MYERIKRLWETKRINVAGLINATRKGLITENQFYALTGATFEEATGNKAGEGQSEA